MNINAKWLVKLELSHGTTSKNLKKNTSYPEILKLLPLLNRGMEPSCSITYAFNCLHTKMLKKHNYFRIMHIAKCGI